MSVKCIMDYNEATELAQLCDLADIEIGRREKRPICSSCSRPLGVCWCKSLNGVKVATSCQVVILQHPHEEKRCLRTSPILEALMPKENYLELKGKKFNASRFPELREILQSRNSILLYPGEQAVDVETLPPVSTTQLPYNIVILDGTWQQAKSIFHRNNYLQKLKQVRLTGNHTSQYVIRTQPTEDALSTVEAAAIVLSTLERNWAIYSLLVDPLKLICEYQISHGAVKHRSKEFLISSGRYKKPVGKRTYKKLKKCGVKNGKISSVEPGSDTLTEDKGILQEQRKVKVGFENERSPWDEPEGVPTPYPDRNTWSKKNGYLFGARNEKKLDLGSAHFETDEKQSDSDLADNDLICNVNVFPNSQSMEDANSVDLRR